jgi:hypothetical protein
MFYVVKIGCSCRIIRRMNAPIPQKYRQRRAIVGLLVIAIVIFAVFAALLALDLANRGLAWRTFYSLTGEEAPLAQIRGMVELGGNLTRALPQTAPDVPVRNTGMSPFGINTFLEQEADPAVREQQVQMIAEAGFDWIRQQFVWEDIEIHGRGDFVDVRNFPEGIDAWAKYDEIVDLAEQYDVEIIGRLDNPPEWSQTTPGNFAPPADFQDFVNFAVAVAERYRGRVTTFQVWNEPNIYPEWGEQNVNPEAYTELLCRTYDALKAVDPNITVISGALSPTVSLTGQNLNEFIFLERMYDAGAGDCFDVLSAQGYGFFSGPPDQRMRPFSITSVRHQYLRDIMIANGDADKPIWISEAAWNPVDSPEVPADISGRENYGVVTPEQAAAYMPAYYQRAMEEFPYLGVINYWFFKRPSDSESMQSWYYFRMVEPDFTPLPIYDSMREYIAGVEPTLYRGVHQVDDWAITLPDTAQTVDDASAVFGQATETTSAEFTADGTTVIVRWQGESDLLVNGEAISDLPDADGWSETNIQSSFFPQTSRIELASETPFLLDTVTVRDDSWLHIQPILWAGLAVFGVLIAVIGRALWQRFGS